MCTGENNIVTYHKYFWQYNFVYNEWIRETDFPEPARDSSVALGLSTKAYVGIVGINASAATAGDFYEYTQNSACLMGIDKFVFNEKHIDCRFLSQPSLDNITITLPPPSWESPDGD